VLIEIDPSYLRPTEVAHLCGDATRARSVLGWKPTVDFASLVDLMTDADLALAEREARSRAPAEHP
jgi:GDPmannose 4,6-dehydratase